MFKGEFTERQRLKYEIAIELGYGDKLMRGGWGQLTAREAGRIGGLMAAYVRHSKEEP